MKCAMVCVSSKRVSRNCTFCQTLRGPRMVLAAAGAVDHEQLVKLAGAAFGSVPDEDRSVSQLVKAVSRRAALCAAAAACRLLLLQLCIYKQPRCLQSAAPCGTKGQLSAAGQALAYTHTHPAQKHAHNAARTRRCSRARPCMTAAPTRSSAASRSRGRARAGPTQTACRSWSCRRCWVSAGVGAPCFIVDCGALLCCLTACCGSVPLMVMQAALGEQGLARQLV